MSGIPFILGFRCPVSGKISLMRIGLVAEPWWVNLAILVPLVAYFSWRRRPAPITAKQLVILGVFASAFGFLEATVVVYLRAAAGLLPGYRGTLSDVVRLSQQSPTIGELPPEPPHSGSFSRSGDIAHVELRSLTYIRERKSPVWPLSSGPLPSGTWSTMLPFWATIRWPHSIRDTDVLFLIPEPWFAPVWFPLVVSALALVAILLTRANPVDS